MEEKEVEVIETTVGVQPREYMYVPVYKYEGNATWYCGYPAWTEKEAHDYSTSSTIKKILKIKLPEFMQ